MCALALALLGLPVEAALRGMLLLRGTTPWLPHAPGTVLAHRDRAQAPEQAAPDREAIAAP